MTYSIRQILCRKAYRFNKRLLYLVPHWFQASIAIYYWTLRSMFLLYGARSNCTHLPWSVQWSYLGIIAEYRILPKDRVPQIYITVSRSYVICCTWCAMCGMPSRAKKMINLLLIGSGTAKCKAVQLQCHLFSFFFGGDEGHTISWLLSAYIYTSICSAHIGGSYKSILELGLNCFICFNFWAIISSYPRSTTTLAVWIYILYPMENFRM